MSTENQQIFTVAYITELDTSQFVTLTAAVAGAEVARHVRRLRAGASEALGHLDGKTTRVTGSLKPGAAGLA